jgi:Ca2+-binding RTX toxin-like protein
MTSDERVITMSPCIQPLESRRLLAAAAAYVVGTTLFVDGTEGNDTIKAFYDSSSNSFQFQVNSVFSAKFPVNSVDSILLRGLGGNDTLDATELRSGATQYAAALDGGAGNDTLVGNITNELRGGDGNDTFNVDFSGGFISGDVTPTIDGGSGTDTIVSTGYVSQLDMRLYGTVENAQVPGGWVWGNELNNLITLTGGGSGGFVHAGGGNDTINGSSSGDTIFGEAGNDSIVGSGGDDSIDGGAGADTMKGGTGRDTIEYGSRTAPLNISADTVSNDGEANEKDNVWNDFEVLHSGSGSDVIRGSAGSERLDGKGGNDTIFGGGGNDTVVGGEGNDSLLGEDGSDTLLGNKGNDTLDGGNAADTLDGGAGTNTLRNGETTITGSLTATLANRVVTVKGSADDDVLSVQRDQITDALTVFGKTFAASSFDSVLLQMLDGNDGAEIRNAKISVVGGNGNDAILTHPGTTVTGFDGGSGTDIYRSDAGGTIDLRLYPTVENVYLSNSAIGMVIGNPLNNNIDIFNVKTITVLGMGGNDTLHAKDANKGTLDGGDGDDNISIDYNGTYTLIGGNGNDKLLSQGSACLMQGGAGNDTLGGGLEYDTLDGGAGADVMAGVNTVYGEGGINDNEGILGSDTVDYSSRTKGVSVTLDGIANDGEPGEGDNVTIVGIMIGGSGNDSLTGAWSFVTQYSSHGATLIGNGGNDILTKGEKIVGGSGDDKLIGFTSENTDVGDSLDGGPGNDTLQGGGNNDRLDGGLGADLMKGGGGFDIVDYSSRKNNLTVGIGTLADDGEAGEKDNVWLDVEEVIGGAGNDKLTGNATNCVLLGLAGNDTLTGGAGVDALHGGSGNDKLFGNANNDFLDGGPGVDTLDGGPGTDKAAKDPSDILISIESVA